MQVVVFPLFERVPWKKMASIREKASLIRHIIPAFIRGGEVGVIGPHLALAHDGFEGFLLTVRRVFVLLQIDAIDRPRFRTLLLGFATVGTTARNTPEIDFIGRICIPA